VASVDNMDSLDEKIIRILKDNARLSFVEIATKLGISEGTIRSRVKKMVDEGVIKKFTVTTASKNIKALIGVKIDININTSEVSKKIRGTEGVETVYEVSGDDDIIAIINVMDSDELNSIIESIRGIDHTHSTKTSMILKEI
jgi:DNA-binding Lrp family transcriptional regulator